MPKPAKTGNDFCNKVYQQERILRGIPIHTGKSYKEGMYCNLYEKNVDLHNYPKAFKRLIGRL